MGREGNDKLRDERKQQEERRQEVRDETFEKTGGDADNLGSQDKRRHEGKPSL